MESVILNQKEFSMTDFYLREEKNMKEQEKRSMK